MTADSRATSARSRHRPFLTLIVAVLLLSAMVVVATADAARSGRYVSPFDGRALQDESFPGTGIVTILAIGSDVGSPMRPGDPRDGRADGIHLFVADTHADRLTVVDIPRDAAVGGVKVNAHLAIGGAQRLEEVLEAWTGLPVDYRVLASFQSVEAVVSELGGVEIDIQQPMQDPFSGTDLQPGSQRLDPVQALAFTRDRKSLADGDIGRSRNQTRLLLAALQQVRSDIGGNVPELLALLATLRQHTDSTIPIGELLPLASAALRIPPENIEHVTIRGPFGFIDTQSVILPQPGDVFQRLAAGQIGPQGQ